MRYILNEYHRNISDQELLDDLKRVANQLSRDTLSQEEYSQHGKFGINTFRHHFGGWNNALLLCDMKPSVYQLAAAKSNPLYCSISDEDLLSDISLVALKLGKKTISSGEYSKNGRFSRDTCFRRFGTWENTLIKAGLLPSAHPSGKRIPDELLLEEIERIWTQIGRQPTSTDIKNGISKYTLNTYTRRFGGWRSALEAFIKWVNSDRDDSSSTYTRVTKEENGFKAISMQSAKIEHTTSRDINLRLRFKVMARDNFKCCLCGASPAKDPNVELQIDHIIPWSKGGETVIDNLQTLCSKCNLGKSDLSV